MTVPQWAVTESGRTKYPPSMPRTTAATIKTVRLWSTWAFSWLAWASSAWASWAVRPKASIFRMYFRRAWTASMLPIMEVMVMTKALRPMVPREDTISSLAPSSAPRVKMSSSRAAV